MPVSNQQVQFLEQFSDIGDIDLCCDRVGVNKYQFAQWITDPDFDSAYQSCRKFLIKNLEDSLAVRGLKSLEKVLKFGEDTVITKIKERKNEIQDLEGNLVEVSDIEKTVTKKHVKVPSWAVNQALRIYLLQRVENNTLSAITQLISDGLLPPELEDQTKAILDETDRKIQDLIGGKLDRLEITKEDLAKVQQMILKGS